MSGIEEVPGSPDEIFTPRQLALFLAAHVRRRKQVAVAAEIESLISRDAAKGLQPLNRAWISRMENATVEVPKAQRLRSYLHGCRRPDLVDVLEKVRARLEREQAEAGFAAGSAAAYSTASFARGPGRVPVAFTSLPSDAGFTGRGGMLVELAAVLTPDPPDGAEPAAVCVIAGLAGIGKTALAVHAAHQAVAQGWFPGGVFFLDLHGYDEGGGVEPGRALAALLRELGVAPARIPQGRDEREALYRAELARWAAEERRVLIVADNAAETRQVLPLRPGAAAHRMLVTSRESLPVPGARRIEAGVLSPQESIGLVTRTLRIARPDDRRMADERAAADELAALCGHLPLALWIAAQQLAEKPEQRVRDQARILGSARDRLGELAIGDSPAVHAAFEATYRRLPADQAEVFRLAGLHPGPYISLDAMAALAGRAADETRRLLDALRRAHLLQPAAAYPGYQFHDLVRFYARERCEAELSPGERDAAIDRLSDYYREVVRAAHSHLDLRVRSEGRFADFGAALAWLEAERPNLIAVIELAVGTGRDRHALDTALSLRFFYDVSKHMDEWQETTLLALAAAERLGDATERCRALNVLCVICVGRHRFDEALDYADRALAAARALGDPTVQILVQINTANALAGKHRYREALEQYEAVLDELRGGVDDRLALAQCVNNVAYMYTELGQLEEAVGHYQESLAVFGELDDHLSIAVTTTNIGDLHRRQGRPAEALDHHERALPVFVELRDRLHEGRALHNLALARHDLGDYDKALEHFAEALGARDAAADRRGAGTTLAAMAETHRVLQQPEKALGCLRGALVTFVEVGDQAEAENVRSRIAAF